MRLVEGVEAEQWRASLEGLSDWNKVTNHNQIIFLKSSKALYLRTYVLTYIRTYVRGLTSPLP